MPLKAVRIRPGVFRENTRYASEDRGWYFCEKVRFRSSQPEKIGGWQQLLPDQFLGVCRSLWPWTQYVGVGTNLKYYIQYGAYYDVTPIRVTGTVTAFRVFSGFDLIGVQDTSVGVGTFASGELKVGSYVTYTGAPTLGGINIATSGVNGTAEYSIQSNTASITCSSSGITLSVSALNSGIVTPGAVIVFNGETRTIAWVSGQGTGGVGDYRLFVGVVATPFSTPIPAGTVLEIENIVHTYFIQATSTASTGITGGAGTGSAYQITVGSEIQYPASALGTTWGSGTWGSGVWGGSSTPFVPLNIGIWTAYNFGNDLLINPKGGGIYYWTATTIGTGTRAVNISTLAGASDTPSKANYIVVSDASRFVLAFGTTDYSSISLDPMLIRWSDQETAADWTPAATTQAGSLRLSHGSAIEAVAQVRQEILVWTDTSLYSLQYLGPPIVWGSQILADNVSIVSDRAWATAAGVTYWMGYEKFYAFDGRVQTLNCDLRQYIFNDFNYGQPLQVFASTVEQFSEVWWFYCSANSTTIDRYVVYNYAEKIWYYGTMARTAWVDASVVQDVPMAADYNNRLLLQETGCDDGSTSTPVGFEAYITSSEFDIDDGHNFGFVWRVLPDITFTGSTTELPAQPSVELSLLTLQNSGSGYTRGVDPVATDISNMSVAGSNSFPVARVATTTVERFTEQVNIRIRARQMAIKVSSDGKGVQWQLGVPRIDVRQDGRKS